MNSLEVDFAGLKLKNPIIAASAPPTETLANIIKCADAGVGAIITKTSANFDESRFVRGGRRVHVDNRGMWAQGTFRRETLPLDLGVALVKESVKRVNIPIIASVGNLNLQTGEWLNSCLLMQDAGASMIQLDLFYLPQPRCSPENTARLRDLLSSLSTRLSIPIAPKLNIDLPSHFAAQILKNTGIRAVFAMDSIRVPVPFDISNERSQIDNLVGAKECSLFGTWQKPITLQYVSVLRRELDVPISAGGGFSNGQDAIEAMMLGATTVQYASAIIRHGYSRITNIVTQMMSYLKGQSRYNNIQDVIGCANQRDNTESLEDFLPATAVVDYQKCINCGVCTRLVFCNDIHLDSAGKIRIEDTCDGCGYCAKVCPMPGALQVVGLDRSI